ncbi:WD40-repeat-containing domain protein [Pilobolus umbonatus]|nr:WD40-repeat-containing domain protein [Pilobolus umbonatus]
MTDSTQYELVDCPRDGITRVCFDPSDSSKLLASSWDRTLRLYNVEENRLIQKFNGQSPILDCCFGDSGKVYTGELDQSVKQYDTETGGEVILGHHKAGTRAVCWSNTKNSLYSGSWDKSVSVWDPRSSPAEISNHKLPNKVFSMDLQGNILAIAMAERHISIYDIRNMQAPWQCRETSLRYMLKAIRLMPNGEGYACSSIEGRVAFEYFDMSNEVQAKRYAFKSHRQSIKETEVVYPVNALAFHPIYGTFASGGSDCIVNIWDGVNRKRVRMFPRYPDEISSLAFSSDGGKLAVASSYTFDEGERDQAPDTIFIRKMEDADVKPRLVQ